MMRPRESGRPSGPCSRRLKLDPDEGTPLFGAVSRLTPQKGLDLLLAIIPELAASGHQLALLGSGDSISKRGFAAAAQAYAGTVAVELGYDEALSHLIIGGADVLLVCRRASSRAA